LSCACSLSLILLFLCTDPPTTEIYTLSLHDALPILVVVEGAHRQPVVADPGLDPVVRQLLGALGEGQAGDDSGGKSRLLVALLRDRKSTRLNSSHVKISYAVFCLKKKIKNTRRTHSA